MEQVKVRDYQTKHFDICPVATSLYKNIESKGVNMEDAEAAARVQDGLFALEKKVIEKGEASHNEVARAIYLQDIIMDFAEKMELESDHSYVQGHVDKIKSYKDSVNENIKSKINSLYKAAKKKLGVKNVVRPTDADFDAAYKHIEDNYPEGYTLMSIGVDAIQDKINIEVGDFYGESEDIVIDRPSVNEARYDGSVQMPSQEEVDAFFKSTGDESHYLANKPVFGDLEPWDEYDYSNWKELTRNRQPTFEGIAEKLAKQLKSK
jgi:hypothetical protein